MYITMLEIKMYNGLRFFRQVYIRFDTGKNLHSRCVCSAEWQLMTSSAYDVGGSPSLAYILLMLSTHPRRRRRWSPTYSSQKTLVSYVFFPEDTGLLHIWGCYILFLAVSQLHIEILPSIVEALECPYSLIESIQQC